MYKVNWLFWPFLLIIDFAGYVLFFWKKLMPFPGKVSKILVIRLDHIGDLLFTTPLFKILKSKYPGAKLDVLCIPEARDVIEGSKNIDKIHELYVPWFSKKNFKGWKYFFRQITELKKENYDLVIELHDDPRNILIASMIGGYSVGYGLRGFGFMLNKIAPYKNKIEQTMYRNLDVIKAIGADASHPKVEVNFDKKAEKSVISWLSKHKIGKYVLIHALTRRPEKNWPIERWAEICTILGGTIIFSGGKSDEKTILEIMSRTKNKNIYSFAGRPLKELYALIRHCSMFIGTDTFATHLASIMEKNVIALYGPTSKKLWGPIGSNTVTIQGLCKDKLGRTLPRGFKEGTAECMNAISVETVLDAVKKIRKNN